MKQFKEIGGMIACVFIGILIMINRPLPTTYVYVAGDRIMINQGSKHLWTSFADNAAIIINSNTITCDVSLP